MVPTAHKVNAIRGWNPPALRVGPPDRCREHTFLTWLCAGRISLCRERDLPGTVSCMHVEVAGRTVYLPTVGPCRPRPCFVWPTRALSFMMEQHSWVTARPFFLSACGGLLQHAPTAQGGWCWDGCLSTGPLYFRPPDEFQRGLRVGTKSGSSVLCLLTVEERGVRFLFGGVGDFVRSMTRRGCPRLLRTQL